MSLFLIVAALFAETFQMMPDPYNYQTGYKIVREGNGAPGIVLLLPPDVDAWKAANILNWKITAHMPSYTVKLLPPDQHEQSSIVLKAASGRVIGYLLVTEEDKPVDPEKALKAALK